MVTLTDTTEDHGITGRVINLRKLGTHLPAQWRPPLAAVADRAFLSLGRRRLAKHPWVINAAGRRLYVDPRDPRAVRLLISGGSFDRPVTELWQQLLVQFDPDVVVDVGCNYGEVILSGTYSPSCRLIAVEASPVIQPFLARSLEEGLPSARLKRVAASDAAGVLGFTIDETSSGLSHVDAGGNIEVRAVRLDSLEELTVPGQRLLIKIDVEGHEVHVLAGLEGVFARATDWRAIIEFVHLTPSAQAAIARDYTVNLVSVGSGRTRPATPDDVADFDRLVRDQTFLKDVILSPR